MTYTQLRMRRTGLQIDPPPAPHLPEGYDLHAVLPEEESSLAEALQSAFPEYSWTPEDVVTRLTGASDVEATFVITCGGRVAATASARHVPELGEGVGYLHWVGAHFDHQGKGLGRAVSLAVMHYCRQKGCTDIVLDTDDFRIPAIRTYLGLGFAPEAGSPPDHAARWERVFCEVGRARAAGG